MSDKDYQALAKWVIINNKMLQTLLGLKLGYKELKKVYKDLVNETEKEFKELERESENNENIIKEEL